MFSRSWRGRRILTRGLAGHSHFHNIRHRKAKVDSKRQSMFQKLSREIYAAIKAGDGTEPAVNPRLARALEAARRASMPKERIKRALESGKSTVGDNTALFEGVFPGGVGVLVRASSARRNAIAGEIRALFSRAGGEFGRAGWMFEDRLAVIVNGAGDREDVALFGMDAGAEEIEVSEDGAVEFLCGSLREREQLKAGILTRFPDVKENVYTVRSVEPQALVAVNEESMAKLEKLLGALDNHSEVVEVVHNARLA